MKTVLITGANGNLGNAVVHKFLENGCQVKGIVHRKSDEVLIKHAAYQEIVADLRNEAACSELIQHLSSADNRIDVAVLTVGGFAAGDLKATDMANIQQQISLNFETAYNMARPVFLQMLRQGKGRIFLISSRQGLQAATGKGTVAYTLAKSLLFRLAEMMNAEAKGIDVVCSVIVPGTIDTPQNRKSMPDADFETWAKPEDIANVISFYAGDSANIIREPVIKVYNKS